MVNEARRDLLKIGGAAVVATSLATATSRVGELVRPLRMFFGEETGTVLTPRLRHVERKMQALKRGETLIVKEVKAPSTLPVLALCRVRARDGASIYMNDVAAAVVIEDKSGAVVPATYVRASAAPEAGKVLPLMQCGVPVWWVHATGTDYIDLGFFIPPLVGTIVRAAATLQYVGEVCMSDEVDAEVYVYHIEPPTVLASEASKPLVTSVPPPTITGRTGEKVSTRASALENVEEWAREVIEHLRRILG